MTESIYDQSCEVEDLASDYADFIKHLEELENPERPTLREFAIWRNEEFEARNEFTNPIPSIH